MVTKNSSKARPTTGLCPHLLSGWRS